jgi:hypothetical protein
MEFDVLPEHCSEENIWRLGNGEHVRKCHAMKMYGGVELKLHTFSMSALDGRESASFTLYRL